ncbi:MAG: hypothetical protein ACYC99_17360 [Candidatus Geothermincolia bacterium]
MTVPADWPEPRIWEYISSFHSGYENAGCLKGVCNYLGLSERRFREWLEIQRTYPIATNDKGVWRCVCKADWKPMLRWRGRRLKAERRAFDRAIWMMMHFHPKHGQLFSTDDYEAVA